MCMASLSLMKDAELKIAKLVGSELLRGGNDSGLEGQFYEHRPRVSIGNTVHACAQSVASLAIIVEVKYTQTESMYFARS